MTEPTNAAKTERPEGTRRRKRWRLIKWCVRLAVLAAVIGYPLIVGCDSFFYHPNDVTYYRPGEFGLRHEDVRFETSDGLTLSGWFLPALGKTRGTVVHFHGNAANISNHIALVAWLPHHNYNLFLFDYRGYGASEGSPTRAGTIRDGHAALDYVRSRPDCRDLPLFIYGQSLGGAVGTVVAADRPEVAAVVAETTFDSYRRVAALHGRRMVFFDFLARPLTSLVISEGHDPADVIAQLAPRPVLIIAAEDDRICYPELGRALFDAASEPKEWWLAPGVGHLAILSAWENELIERITSFFDEAARQRSSSRPAGRP